MSILITKITNQLSLQSTKGFVLGILKLFDASSNSYRSVTNVLLEYIRLQSNFDQGLYDLHIKNFVSVDSSPLETTQKIANKDLCSVCGRFRQKLQTYALISGNPKTDSSFQIYHSKLGKRTEMKVCAYCFCAGWVDLPTAKINKDGNNVGKEREYLFITTPLSKEALEDLINLIAQFGHQIEEDSDENATDSLEISSPSIDIDDFMQSLQEQYGIEAGDSLSVIGLSAKRMREIQGFVLQGANQLSRTLVLRVPIERLIGEDKVSGAVRRELMKATMYDFWRITGGSLHYGRLSPNTPFSISGQSISPEEMYRANQAYAIAHRYARIGRYRQLNSSLFMLLLSHPRKASNRIFNTKKREKGGRYAPGNDNVKEIISMTEKLAEQTDWQFQLGLQIVEILVETRLTKRAKGFWKNKKEQYTGVELVKWLQRIKMVRDRNSARAWGTSLINGYRRENNGQGPNAEIVAQILLLVEKIIETCEEKETPLGDFARNIAEMDYYLLFYYNQNHSE